MIVEIPESAQALIFDLDGTLVDSTAVHFAAWQHALAEVGVELPRSTFQELFGKNNPTIVKEMEERSGKKIPLEEVSRKKDEYFARNITMVMPNRQVVEVAERYVGLLPLAVATNEKMGIANMVLRVTGLQPHFEILVSGDEVERPKPAPDLFLTCASRLGLSPEGCHVFEDSEAGLQAAREAGMSVTDVRPYL
jgi:HAD superfamily hydrolase (TIGR01509 family)